jgi:peroxiredoxin
MPAETDRAPLFSAPVATPHAATGGSGEYTGEDVSIFELEEALSTGPVVLAFFPGVFSRTCTKELCSMRDWWADLEELDAAVYGVSADTPFSQLAFIDEYDVNSRCSAASKTTLSRSTAFAAGTVPSKGSPNGRSS